MSRGNGQPYAAKRVRTLTLMLSSCSRVYRKMAAGMSKVLLLAVSGMIGVAYPPSDSPEGDPVRSEGAAAACGSFASGASAFGAEAFGAGDDCVGVDGVVTTSS
eukprot:7153398-Prymnesium_polylepis.3